jgi:hypothetical protein
MAKKNKIRHYVIKQLTWAPSRSSYRLVEAHSPFATYVWDGVDKILMISEQYAPATEKEFEDIEKAIWFASEHHRKCMENWLESR